MPFLMLPTSSIERTMPTPHDTCYSSPTISTTRANGIKDSGESDEGIFNVCFRLGQVAMLIYLYWTTPPHPPNQWYFITNQILLLDWWNPIFMVKQTNWILWQVRRGNKNSKHATCNVTKSFLTYGKNNVSCSMPLEISQSRIQAQLRI